jgi:hypothetical protein
MRRIVIGIVTAAILGGIAYYGLFVVPSKQFRTGLDQAIATLPPGYTVHYGGARYSLLSRTAVITDLSVQGPATFPINETIAKVTVEGPALDFSDRWNKAQANPSALTPDQALPVVDRIMIEGVKIHGAANGSLASTSMTKIRLYPWALLRPGVPALKDIGDVFAASMRAQALIAQQQKALTARQQESADQTGDSGSAAPSPADIQALQKQSLEAVLPVIRLEAVVFLAIGYDSADGSGLDLTISLPATGAPGPQGDLHVGMNTFHAGALDRAIGGANTVDGLTEDLGAAGKVSVDHASIGNYVLRDAATRLANGDPLSMAMLDGATIGPMEMDSMSMTLPTGGNGQIQKIAMTGLSFDHSFLKSFGFNATGIKQDVASMDERTKVGMRQLGLNSVTANLGAAFQWDADKKMAALRDVIFSVNELGSIQVDADLAGIDPANPAASLQSSLAKATVHYQDSSLINRLLSAGGPRTPAQLEQMRQAFAANLLRGFGPVASDPKLAGSVKAISDFAKAPHSLTITLAPPAPVPVAAIKTLAAQGPQVLVDTLGLSITANQ